MFVYSLLITVTIGVWLATLLFLRDVWTRLVDREYDFWERTPLRGLLASDRLRAFEKGFGLTVLVAVLFAYVLALTVFLFVRR